VIMSEFASVPFETIIGGPLNACVKAQNVSSKHLIDFIKDVGFLPSPMGFVPGIGQAAGSPGMTGGPGTPVNPPGPGGMPTPASGLPTAGATQTGRAAMVTFEYAKENQDGTTGLARMSVPFLCLVPIPYVRITHFSVEFSVKLDSHEYKNNSSSKQESGSHSRMSYVKNSTNKNNQQISREYSMKIRVKAKSEEIPGGMLRLLNILEKGMFESLKEDAKEKEEEK